MSKQNRTQTSANRCRSRQASQPNDAQIPAFKRPTNRDKEVWKAYWAQKQQNWRIEPEIDEKRQRYLAERRNIMPNIEQGTYPFKNVQLKRADIEWLLATHKHGDMQGPIDWHDESQREHEGLDLRGADLHEVDLQNLPLAGLCGGLNRDEWCWYVHGEDGHKILSEAGVHLEQANLSGAHLEGTSLIGTFLVAVSVKNSYLNMASLNSVNGEKADFRGSHLEEADFADAYLEEASFGWAYMQKAIFSGACLKRADFSETHLEGADFCQANMELVNFTSAYLNKAILGAQPRDEIFEGPH